MKIAIMQPYFLPYIGYFQLIHAVDKFILYDDVNYINRGWINRNRMLLNGKEHLFTVPLESASQNRLIKDICIVSGTNWENKLLTTFAHAYKKAPQYENIMPYIEKIIRHKENNISKRIVYSLKILRDILGINTTLEESSVKYNNQNLKAQDRILDICIQENADIYINPIGGTDLYDKKTFDKSRVSLCFIKTNKIFYNQCIKEFVPNLSIIDVLMFNEARKIADELLPSFTLI